LSCPGLGAGGTNSYENYTGPKSRLAKDRADQDRSILGVSLTRSCAHATICPVFACLPIAASLDLCTLKLMTLLSRLHTIPHVLQIPSERFRSTAAARLAGWLLLLAAALLYLGTLDTGLMPGELVGGDLITHQYAQVQARPGNAPGYPLYTMGGWLWFHGLRGLINLLGEPLPNPMPILSSYNTLWALIALWLLYRILLRLSRSSHWPAGYWPLAWLISAFYAVTYFFWYYATTTEQYSSAIAQTLAIVYVYLLWQDARMRGCAEPRIRDGARASQTSEIGVTPAHPRIRASALLLLLAFLCGLSLAHMVTVAMIVPPLVAVVLWSEPQLLRRPLMVLGAVTAAGVPLLSYIYVYARGGSHPEWWGEGDWASASDWFWSFVLTAQGQEELSWGLEPGAPFFANGFPELIWQELSVPLLLLGLVGIAWLSRGTKTRAETDAAFSAPFRGDRRLVFLLYGTLFLYLILCWVDRFGNWFQVILPAYPLILMGLLPVFQGMVKRIGRISHLLSLIPFLLLIGAIVWRIDASLPAADSRHRPEDTALIQPALLLDQPLPYGAVLFAEKEDALGLDYLISIWGIRPDLRIVSSPRASDVLDQGGVVLATWTSTSLLRSEVDVTGPLRLEAATPDWVALNRGDDWEASAPLIRLDRQVGDGITLAGYALQSGPTGEPVLSGMEPSLDLTLYWQVAPGVLPQDWSVSVRALQQSMLITAADGHPIQQDSAGPVHGLRPFSGMQTNEIVADSYRLPGEITLDGFQIVLYRSTEDGFENLAVVEWEVK
jgi:hypothetical protein